MKKTNHHRVWTGLMACLLAVTAWMFNGCSDESENRNHLILYETFLETKNEIGTLFYDENTNSWVIVSDSVVKNSNDSVPERAIVYSKSAHNDIENETFKDYIGQKVIFSGRYTERVIPIESRQYYSYLVGPGYYISTLVLEEISLYSSRSVVENEQLIECGTVANTPPVWFFSRDLADGLDYSKAYAVNVFVHVVRNSQGVGLNKATVSSEIIYKLNFYYSNSNISFVLIGSDYIDSDDLINLDVKNQNYKTNLEECFSTNRVSNAINIYKLSSSPNMYNINSDSNYSYISGKSESIPGLAYILTENETETTVTHEMGHCLGLYHTHHGTSLHERSEGSCMELVDGSNSSTCGDYITDTPADPNQWDGCDYIGIETDANNDVYAPDPSNMMAYSPYYCRNHFSQKQVERMHHVLNYSNAHQMAATITNREITGPTQIGTASSYTYSINVPSNAAVLWTIDCISYNSVNSGAVNYTTSGTGSTITLENRYPNALSQKYVINATIYMGTGSQRYEYFASKTVYKISNPSQTGTLTWSSESPCGDYLGTINMANPNNSTIKVHKGGILTFHYTDVCGASSYTDTDVFNFEIYNLNATKELGANNVFLIDTNAIAPSNNRIILSLIINGMGNMFQIPIEVLPCSQSEWMSIEDSTELEIMEIIDKDELLHRR